MPTVLTQPGFPCHTCGLVHATPELAYGQFAQCTRCGDTLTKRSRFSSHLTGAFALAALILYFPANIFPILQLNMYGTTSYNTIWAGCVKFYQEGDFFIALVVFMASIFIPFLKLLGLFFLVVSTHHHFAKWPRLRTRLFKAIEVLGRWAMLDVFVLAILVSLVKLQSIATVLPGPGLIAFTAVVILTNLASASFNPRDIWDFERCEET